MNTQSHLVEGSNCEKFEINEEKFHPPTTLDKIELNERDINCALLQDKKDTELELIHNYAQRIKSFLGWESNLEEKELNNEYDGIENEAVDGGCHQKDSHSPENSESAIKEKIDCLGAISNLEEVSGKEKEVR